MQSPARTVAEYLASLPADRRAAIAAVRQVILQHLDALAGQRRSRSPSPSGGKPARQTRRGTQRKPAAARRRVQS
jgi:hypothetical protein